MKTEHIKKWKVTIRATIKKTLDIDAWDRKQAKENATFLFSPDWDKFVDWTEEVISVKRRK